MLNVEKFNLSWAWKSGMVAGLAAASAGQVQISAKKGTNMLEVSNITKSSCCSSS